MSSYEKSLYPKSQVARDLKSLDVSINELLFENIQFSFLNLDQRILQGLAKSGFSKLSAIQKEAVPLGRIGVDMVLQARSGSGKTCAYTVIALDSLLDSDKTQILIVTPTREIAYQVSHVIKAIGAFFDDLKVTLVTGGFKVGRDVLDLEKAQIVIGTPGRLIQLIELNHLKTTAIRLLILDEADKLFEEQMRDQIASLFRHLPEDKQVIAVSATFPENMKPFIDTYLKDPQMISVNDKVPFPLRNHQYYAVLPQRHCPAFKNEMVKKWIDNLTFNQIIIFVNTKESGQKIADDFKRNTNYRCAYLFGDLAQSERYLIFRKFHGQKFNMLVTTDLFSRGVDCQNVNMVINYDLPDTSETFLHRIGRAGRFGLDCLTLTLVEDGPEEVVFEKYAKKMGFLARPIPKDFVKDNPWGVLDERYKYTDLNDYQKYDRMVNWRRFRPPCKKYRPPTPPFDEDLNDPIDLPDHGPRADGQPRRNPFMKRKGLYYRKYPPRPSFTWDEINDDWALEKWIKENSDMPIEYYSSSSEDEDAEVMPPSGWPGCCGGHIMPGTNRWYSLDEDGKPLRFDFNSTPVTDQYTNGRPEGEDKPKVETIKQNGSITVKGKNGRADGSIKVEDLLVEAEFEKTFEVQRLNTNRALKMGTKEAEDSIE